MLLHTQCLCTEIANKPTGADITTGTLLLGNDCEFHAMPALATPVPIQEEGVTVQATPTFLNFVGAGVTAAVSGAGATVTVPATAVQEEGVVVQANPTFVNFIGASATAVANGAGVDVTIVPAVPLQEEGVQVQAAPTFLNIAGTALTATASGAGGLVTIDPYATNAEAQAGTSVRTIVNPADLFARENIAAQTGLANNPALIPAPTAGQSNWGTTLLGETVHYVPNIGWRVVANYASGLLLLPAQADTGYAVVIVHTVTAHRAGVVVAGLRARVSSLGGAGACNVTCGLSVPSLSVGQSGDTIFGVTGAVMNARINGAFPVAAGDVISFNYLSSQVTATSILRADWQWVG